MKESALVRRWAICPVIVFVLLALGCGGTSKAALDLDNPQEKIVFVSTGEFGGGGTSATQNIWVMNADGTGTRPLTMLTAASSYDPTWSPDGTRIAFTSWRLTDGSDRNGGPPTYIWVMNADGTGALPLVWLGGRPGWPLNDYADWSPDGTRIAFLERNPKDFAAPYIFVFNADGTGGKAVSYSADCGGPKWSPDGTKLVCGTRLVNADGTGFEYIGGGSNPVWSPDQTKIAFASDGAPDGSYARNSMNIWIMNADGTDPKPLTDYTSTPGNSWTSFRPKWSPDGTKIIFSSDRALDGGDAPNANFAENIWIINADGSAKMPLTRLTQADNQNPVWSPSGTKIAFDSTRVLDGSDEANANMTTNIWTINADGTGSMPLTKITAPAYNGTPQWHR